MNWDGSVGLEAGTPPAYLPPAPGFAGTVVGTSVAITTWYGYDPFIPLGMKGTYNLQLQVVPVPAAAWLFGPALAALGWLRRRPG